MQNALRHPKETNASDPLFMRRELCAAALEDAAFLGLDLGRTRLNLEWTGRGGCSHMEDVYLLVRPAGGVAGEAPHASLLRDSLSERTRSLASGFLGALVGRFPETRHLDQGDGGEFEAWLDLRSGSGHASAWSRQSQLRQVEMLATAPSASPISLGQALSGPMGVAPRHARAVARFCARLGRQLGDGGELAMAVPELAEIEILAEFEAWGETGELESVEVDPAGKSFAAADPRAVREAMPAVNAAIHELLTCEEEEALCQVALSTQCGAVSEDGEFGRVAVRMVLPTAHAPEPCYRVSRQVLHVEDVHTPIPFDGRLPADPEIAARFARPERAHAAGGRLDGPGRSRRGLAP